MSKTYDDLEDISADFPSPVKAGSKRKVDIPARFTDEILSAIKAAGDNAFIQAKSTEPSNVLDSERQSGE